jgi:hypothetical protein
MEYTVMANYSGSVLEVLLWGKVLALHVVGQVSQVPLGIVACLSCQFATCEKRTRLVKSEPFDLLPQVTQSMGPPYRLLHVTRYSG